jgi:uncharacterized protein (TIGR02453 family)
MADAFDGFRPEALEFLVGLALNNDRAWFQPRKADYERLLKEPLEAFCVALDAEFRARGIPLTADPKRSPFRIYRDIRFSRDKTPYKTAASASFGWNGPGGGVGGYFHLEPGHVYVGGGMWHPSSARIAAWRRMVIADRERVHAALDEPAFRDTFGDLDGDRLQRVPTGFPKDDPDVDLLRLKDVTYGVNLADAETASPALPSRVAELLSRSAPLLALLAGLPQDGEVPWLRN